MAGNDRARRLQHVLVFVTAETGIGLLGNLIVTENSAANLDNFVSIPPLAAAVAPLPHHRPMQST